MKDSPYFKQAELLLDVLPTIGRYEVFALKGGTAINFFVRDLPRLSIDIDLTYLPIADRQATLTSIQERLQQIKRDLERHSLSVVPSVLSNSMQWKGLVVSRPDATIKIEPNLIIRGSVYPPEKLSLHPNVEDVFECSVDMQCLARADLYGGKICATLDRQHPRDLYDIRLLLLHGGLTEEIRKAFIVYLISHNRPIVELLDPGRQDLQTLYEQEFVGMARDPVPLDELLATREELIRLLNTGLSSDEKQFLLSVKQGLPNWELLGIEGVANLPAVQWKLINIGRMNPTEHQQAINKLKHHLEK